MDNNNEYIEVRGKVRKDALEGNKLGPGGVRKDNGQQVAQVIDLEEIDDRYEKYPESTDYHYNYYDEDIEEYEPNPVAQAVGEALGALAAELIADLLSKGYNAAKPKVISFYHNKKRVIGQIINKRKENRKKIRRSSNNIKTNAFTTKAEVILNNLEESRKEEQASIIKEDVNYITPPVIIKHMTELLNKYYADKDNRNTQKLFVNIMIGYIAIIYNMRVLEKTSMDNSEWKQVIEELTNSKFIDTFNELLSRDATLLDSSKSDEFYSVFNVNLIQQGEFIPIAGDHILQILSKSFEKEYAYV